MQNIQLNDAKFANHYGHTDVNPYEIVRVISDKTIEIRRMKSTKDEGWKPVFHAGGFAANCSNQQEQKWIITVDESAQVIRARLGKNGWKSAFGEHVLANEPIRFYDYNF